MTRAISVLGAGNYGTALAHALSKNVKLVRLHVYEQDVFQVINMTRVNAKYLPDVELNLDVIEPMLDIERAVSQASVVFIAVPTQYVESLIGKIRKCLPEDAILVLTSKGILKNGLRISEIIKRELPNAELCAFYGITFARLIARGDGLTSVCVAADKYSVAKKVAGLFGKRTCARAYISNDIKGAEFGGAMKNVYAIFMGIVDEYFDILKSKAEQSGDDSAKALLDSRSSLLNLCLLEFIHFGLALGGSIQTLIGPSGVGDIVASSCESYRNYRYGRWLASLYIKRTPAPLISLHEGYDTIKGAYCLACDRKIDAPILGKTHGILYEKASITDAIPQLIGEFSGAVSLYEKRKKAGPAGEGLQGALWRLLERTRAPGGNL